VSTRRATIGPGARCGRGTTTVGGVTIVETVLVYLVIPVSVVAVAAALILGPKREKDNPRYRSGEGWEYGPVWWSANPDGVGGHADVASDSSAHELASGADANAGLVGGGARGTW
jgi:hypothetical protein